MNKVTMQTFRTGSGQEKGLASSSLAPLLCSQPVPFDNPAAPMFLDGLGEIRMHQFDALLEPVIVLATKNKALDRTGMVCTGSLQEQVHQSVQ